MSKGKQRTWAMLGVGLAVSALFLYLALRHVDSGGLSKAFSSVNLLFVLTSAAALVMGLLFRALRWRVIATAPLSAHRSFYRATNVGALSNLLLPGRLGEIARIVTLTQLSGMRLTVAVASALIDRLIDVFVLLVSALTLNWLLPLSAALHRSLIILLVSASVIVTGFLILAWTVSAWQASFARFAKRWLFRWKMRPEEFLGELQVEIRQLLHSCLSVRLALLAVMILGADCAAVAASMWALNIFLPIRAALLLWVFISAGSLLPSAPGYVGVYQLAAVWALSYFAVPPSGAVAVAVVLQITTLTVAALMVGPSFWGFAKSALVARN